MAFLLGLKDRFERIALVGNRPNVLETHLIDLRECFGEETSTVISGGGYDELDGADLVIMTGAIARQRVASRDEYLLANLEVVIRVAREIKSRAPKATLINCTSPVDAYVMVFLRELGWDRRRVLGFCRNDSQRFRHMAGKVLGLNPANLGGLSIGEHGQTQVPLFSTLTHNGRPLVLSSEQKVRVLSLLKNWYSHWQFQNSQRTTTWTSATSMWRTLTALGLVPAKSGGESGDSGANPPFGLASAAAPGKAPGPFDRPGEPAIGSVALEGEYGLSGVALGLPIEGGPMGWARIIEMDLWPGELAALQKSAEKVKSLYNLCQ